MTNIYERIAAAPQELVDLAVEWPLVTLLKLPPGATIVVAGAYRGRVMELLAIAYPDYGRLVGFEPQHDARAAAIERLAEYRDVYVEPYGLGDRNGSFPMAEFGNEFAGFVNLGPENARTGNVQQGEGELRDVAAAFRSLELRHIDLMLLNIEGYEFTLVPHLLATGAFRFGYIERLALQVHWGMGDDTQYGPMIAELERTHKRVFDEVPSWGLWQWSGRPGGEHPIKEG